MQEWVSLSNRYHAELRNFLMRSDGEESGRLTSCAGAHSVGRCYRQTISIRTVLGCRVVSAGQEGPQRCEGSCTGVTIEQADWRFRNEGQRHHFVPIDEGI